MKTFVFWLASKFDKILFTIALTTAVFVVGIATAHYDLAPYQFLKNAKRGLTAFGELEFEELPPNVQKKLAPDAAELIVDQMDGTGGSEAIFVTGGFYQLLSECPNFGCMAWITDRSGKILHTWSADPNEIFDGDSGVVGFIDDTTFFVTGARLTSDGGLITVFQGHEVFPFSVGIARFDIDGNLLWRRFDWAHHWPTIAEDGTIYSPVLKVEEDLEYFGNTITTIECDDRAVLIEGVRNYSPDGDELSTMWFDEMLAEADYPGMSYTVPNDCNPHHINGVGIVNANAAAKVEGLSVGDLAVSMREASAVALIDRKNQSIVKILKGRFAGQHSPVFLDDGQLLIFDNLGGQRSLGGSRIVALDIATNTIRVVFPHGDEGEPVLPFRSPVAGVLDVSPDSKRILISETTDGRIIEVDVATSNPLWTYEKSIDLGLFLEERGIKSDSQMVRFGAHGAYYVDSDNPVLAGSR